MNGNYDEAARKLNFPLKQDIPLPRSVELGKHLFRTLRFQILRVLHQSKDSLETSLFCRSRAVVSSFYLSRSVFPTLSLNLVYLYFFLSVFLFDTRLLTKWCIAYFMFFMIRLTDFRQNTEFLIECLWMKVSRNWKYHRILKNQTYI